MRERKTKIQPSKSRRVWVAIVAAVVGGTILAACSGGPPPAAKDDDGGGDKVSMRLIAFNPETLAVKTGAKVTWTQEDMGASHTVTSGTVTTDATGTTSPAPDGKFDSGPLEGAKTFSFTFDASGTYPYFCEVHPSTMQGEVTVE